MPLKDLGFMGFVTVLSITQGEEESKLSTKKVPNWFRQNRKHGACRHPGTAASSIEFVKIRKSDSIS